MPITAQLEHIKHFESVGFTHKQSEVLVEIAENNAVETQESLKDFIRREIDLKTNQVKIDLIKWMVTLLLAQTGIIAALVKLL